jgi:molybdopterin/thiamine biosynthesis adenylyltransferase
MHADNRLDSAARILQDDDPLDATTLETLRADPGVEFIDRSSDLLTGLRELRPERPDLLDESVRWAYYPWRRTVVAILGPRGFRALRLDRNRHLITTDEQNRLGELRIAVAGLSVGHVIAHTIAAEGLCGSLRLADFDQMELSNLNRVPATLLDLGVNKAVVAARRIAELDPYLDVEVVPDGVTPESLEHFLDGTDIVVEECDSFHIKVLIREAARVRRIPVLMATSDRGLIDVERFDTEAQRPVLHGLLGPVDAAYLAGLSNRDRIPYMLRHLDAGSSSARLTASLVELNETLSTWPQLAGEVTAGAAAVAEAVRRIGLGEPLASGQTRIDIGAALDGIAEPDTDTETHDLAESAPPNDAVTALAAVAEAANRAPSGGNSQPWVIEIEPGALHIRIAPEHTSMMDVAFRGSAVAIGAATFNARIAAASFGVLGPLQWSTDGPAPLAATLRIGTGADAGLASLYQPMLRRETNRHLGTPQAITAAIADVLHHWARREGARLTLMTSRQDIETAAEILRATDRIRFLTPRLHHEMIAELRWPGDLPADSGIDVSGLELDPGGLAVLEIMRRYDVMRLLAQWDAGNALGDDVRDRVRATSAIGLVTVQGRELADFARGGSAAEAVWIMAQQLGLSVHPVSPVFLHAVYRDDLALLSPHFAHELLGLQSRFRTLTDTGPDESQVLILRIAHAASASTRSRRRLLVQRR